VEIEFKEIDGIIKGEASLCYRLLRYLNSAAFGFSSEIQSVKHGLSILGEREVRRWVRMVATLGAGQDKPSDLVLSAMVRARYCELLGPRISHGQSDLFLVGLLSLMDAILEIPMGVVLEGITLDRETRAVLLGQKSELDPMYRLMLSQEAADWPKLSALCTQLKLPESFVAECHWKAMQWAREMTAEA
jgi:EAL and modified HD-GYP domain-containing signal transduction protein